MEEQRLKNLIKVWYEKARQERDPFSKFTFLWFCFNAWISFKSRREKDAEMIDWLISERDSNSDIVREFNRARGSEVFTSYLNSLANLQPMNDSRGIRGPIFIRDKTDFEGLVRGIYMVRCNLFHGGKEVDDIRDQKLVSISGKILEKWIGNLVSSWRTI